MACTRANMFKEFKKLEADSLQGDKTVAQAIMEDLLYLL